MTCAGILSGHDPRTPVNRYVLLTRAGARVVHLCAGCAASFERTGAALRPDRRLAERVAS